MAGDNETGICKEDCEYAVTSLINISDSEPHIYLSREVPCYGWSAMSRWDLTASNVTYLTCNPRAHVKKKKGKADCPKKTSSLDMNVLPSAKYTVQTRRGLTRRNYGTISYDIPTWRFIVNSNTFEYLARGDPAKMNSNKKVHRMGNKSANFRNHKRNYENIQLDPAMFFDDQLCVALADRDLFFSGKIRPLERPQAFIEVVTNPTTNKVKAVQSTYSSCIQTKRAPSPGNLESRIAPINDDSLSSTNSGYNVDLVNSTVREQPCALSTHRNKGTLCIKSSSVYPYNTCFSCEIQRKSRVLVNRVKLLQDYGQKKREDRAMKEKREKLPEKVKKNPTQHNNKAGEISFRYSHLGLPVAPKAFAEKRDKAYVKNGLRISSCGNSLNVSNSSIGLASDTHLPAITNTVTEEEPRASDVWEDRKGALLPPIFGTKMELSISNSNQSLL